MTSLSDEHEANRRVESVASDTNEFRRSLQHTDVQSRTCHLGPAFRWTPRSLRAVRDRDPTRSTSARVLDYGLELLFPAEALGGLAFDARQEPNRRPAPPLGTQEAAWHLAEPINTASHDGRSAQRVA